MKALMITPAVAGSSRLDEYPEPLLSDGSIHVEVLAVGICGTDLEIVAGQVIVDATTKLAPDGVLCLTGVSSGGHRIEADFGAINRSLALENGVIVGSVNANRRHYEAAAEQLAAADPLWLAKIITRQVPLEQWAEALVRQPTDVKAVLRFAQ